MSAPESFRVWPEGRVEWGLTVCEAPGCFAPAVLLADYNERAGEGVPLCLTDAELQLERELALEREPALAGLLPDPWELGRRRRGRRPRELADYEVVNEAGDTLAERTPERWLAEKGWR